MTKVPVAVRGFNTLDLKVEGFTVRYRNAEAILTSLVARTVLSGTLGTPKVRRAVKAQVRVMLEELDRAGVPEAKQIVDQAYDLGRRIAEAERKGQTRIDQQALSLLKENISGRLTDSTVHVGRRVDDIFRKEGLRVAASALGGVEDPNIDVSLQRALTNQGVTAFTDRNGRRWGLAEYARMAVKTTTAEAVFHGTQATMLKQGLDLVVVNRVANPCDVCINYDGKTFSLTGRSKDHPLLDMVFPIHPGCSHYISPSPEAFAERAAAA